MLSAPQQMGLAESSEPCVSFIGFVELSCLSGNSLLDLFFFLFFSPLPLDSKVLMQYLFTTIHQEAQCSLAFIQTI